MVGRVVAIPHRRLCPFGPTDWVAAVQPGADQPQSSRDGAAGAGIHRRRTDDRPVDNCRVRKVDFARQCLDASGSRGDQPMVVPLSVVGRQNAAHTTIEDPLWVVVSGREDGAHSLDLKHLGCGLAHTIIALAL